MVNYDLVYSEAGFYWGKEPNSLAKKVVYLLNNNELNRGKLVDFGSGEGKDLIYFAKSGFEATGVELSLPGVEKARLWAKEAGLTVNVLNADINSFLLNDIYDVIYSSGSITFISPELRKKVFDSFKSHTREGGINALNAFVEKPFLEVPPDWGESEFFYRSGELMSYYWDWELLYVAEDSFKCNSNNVPHRHVMDTVIARKTEND